QRLSGPRQALEKAIFVSGAEGESMTEIRCLLEKRSVLGEGPIWRPRENSLYWIDLKAPAIYCFDVITRQNRQIPAALGKIIGGMVFARDGRMIIVEA